MRYGGCAGENEVSKVVALLLLLLLVENISNLIHIV